MTRLDYFITILVLLIKNVNCEFIDVDSKSSLTFVIDDTGSMWNEIAQVKEGAKAIFDIVLNSKESQIEDFVLVTFNDPHINYRTTTRSIGEFKDALDSIHVSGGGDCPEMCMSGIERAIIESRPRSQLYVFTDASALDYEKYERVKALAQKKVCQIIFVLTGMCSDESDPQYQVYVDLAKATSGVVFHMEKTGIEEILKHVQESVKSRQTVIVNKEFPSGPSTLTYDVDGLMKEMTIIVSGTEPTVKVTGPDGRIVETEDVLRTPTVAEVKVTSLEPGVYTADVYSKSRTWVVVTGATTLHFQHGFSQIKPTSIGSTSTRPLPRETSYVAIQLKTDGGDIVLNTLQIRDMDDNIISEVPYKVTADKENQFYVTEKLDLPRYPFRIAIKGYDSESKTEITRISLTSIEPQIIEEEEIRNIPPKVAIVGKHDVTVIYKQYLELICRINAYPEPTVVWEDSSGNVSPANLTAVELPSDFVSVLNIDSVRENKHYTCKARNDYGVDEKTVTVKTKRVDFFKILEAPKSADIELNSPAKFTCKVEAYPPATIKWFKDRRRIKIDDNIRIKPDGSELIINKMQPEYKGFYMCTARNENEHHALRFYIGVSGTELPQIDKKTTEVRTLEGTDVNIECRLLRGRPRAVITWYFQHGAEETIELTQAKGKETLRLSNLRTELSGTYRCEARNHLGADYHYTDVIVEYPPTIKRGRSEMRFKEGDKVRIHCRVEGEPKPEVKWFVNDTEVDTRRFSIHDTNSLNFKATLIDTGNYSCQARNAHGTAYASTQVFIYGPPTIATPRESRLEVAVGSDLRLPCEAWGEPKPVVVWNFYSTNPKVPSRKLKTLDPEGALSLRMIQLDKEGYYTCQATNVVGTANITYEVKVLAPPQIWNTYAEKTFQSVIGDRALRIRCEATGNPKPDIVWIREDSYKVPAESEWFDIDVDGTLVIKGVDKDAGGRYTCEARNRLGVDRKEYYVEVLPYPTPDPPNYIKMIEEGQSQKISCEIPHTKTDSVRWFKDGTLLAEDELEINNAKPTDSGVYVCRVSTFDRATNANVNVTVGFKPRFLYPEEKHIELEEGLLAVMDCYAEGNPEPKASWWHGGKKIPFDGMRYSFEMKASDVGKYTCLVENSFGRITRSYEISTRDCLLHVKDDFAASKQPLMVSLKSEESMKFASYERLGEYIRIPASQYVLLYCDTRLENTGTRYAMVKCEQQKQFSYRGKSYDYGNFQCSSEQKTLVENTTEPCLNGNKMVKVGYEIFGRFQAVYSVCFDHVKQIPLYAKYSLDRYIADVEKKSHWIGNEIVPYDLDSMYDCERQKDDLYRKFGVAYSGDSCCYAPRLLVNSKDVRPGLPQVATSHLMNQAPQWSSCNSKNWDAIEQHIRNLAKSSTSLLKVWTGQYLPRYESAITEIIDSHDHRLPVPLYLWKVVQDEDTKESVAIVHVNIPNLTNTEAARYKTCTDVCPEIEWMGKKSWADASNGYIFCCSIKEFESRFGYRDVFGNGKLLYKNLLG